MKRFTILVFLFSSVANAMDNKICNSTDKQIYNKQNPLLACEEAKCWLWFDEKIQIRADSYKGISEHDRAVIEKKKAGDRQESYRAWADKFFLIALTNREYNPEKDTHYSVNILTMTLIKMSQAIADKSIEEPTDRPTARIFAYSKLLSDDERKKISPSSYKSNSFEGDMVFQKLAILTVNELVKLGIVKDDSQTRQQEEQAFIEHKKLEYKLFYGV